MPEQLVSIALCVYNGGSYLEQQLQTLLQQTYTNLELVVVDDGSTDHSVTLIEQYAATDSRIRLITNTRNLGYVKNFEKAINLCKGDFIALADQDDIWDLRKIEIMVREIGEALLVYHDSRFIDGQGKPMGKVSDIMNMYAGNSAMPFLFYNCISGHSCMFRRELVEKLGEFNPEFYHDWWIAFVAASTGSISYIDQTLVQYRQHQLSNTDILNRKQKVAQGPKYAEINIAWLHNCARLRGNCQDLVGQIIYLYEHKSPVNACRLFQLLFKYRHELFFLKKKGMFNKLNYMRKMVFFTGRQSHTLKH